jgi:O-antigen/teichoic acid export membrane protein
VKAGAPPRVDPTGLANGSGALAANSILTLLGQGLPLVVGLLLTPFILNRLGKDGFGVLSLGWTVLTLSLVFNLGLGRATTKYAADHLATRQAEQLPSLFWLSVFLNLVFGVIGGLLVAGVSLVLLQRQVLGVPAGMTGDAGWMFVALAAALPFTFATTTLRGMLEAGQRFAGMSVARLVFNTAVFALPAVVLLFSPRLGVIGFVLSLSRILEAAVYSWLCLRHYPSLASVHLSRRHLRPLLAYGGWLTVTNMLLPLILNMDRFIVGAVISIQAVAYYAVPTDFVTRLTLLPASVIVPLFPAFSALNESGDRARLSDLYLRTLKYVALAMGFVAALGIAAARPFLELWVGAEFARESGLVMQIAVVSILVNSIGFLPSTVLQAVGRPDLTAKAHLVETPIAVAAMWYLTRAYGIAGTAVAWGLRVLLDTAILFAATSRLGLVPRTSPGSRHSSSTAVLVTLLVAGACGVAGIPTIPWRATAFVVLAAAWAAFVWLLALDPSERHWIRNLPHALAAPISVRFNR